MRMNLSPWTMIYRMSRPGENHDSWKAPCDATHGGEAAIFANRGKNTALYALSRDFQPVDRETRRRGSESEKFAIVNEEAQLSASDSSRTIDKEESRTYVIISRRILFSPKPR